MPVSITTRIDDKLAKIIEQIAKVEGLDSSTAIWGFLSRAVKEWLIENSLDESEEGKLTLWQAAEKCRLSLWEIIDEARKREIQVPYSLEEPKEEIRGLE
mgnify:CR=1 FL=1